MMRSSLSVPLSSLDLSHYHLNFTYNWLQVPGIIRNPQSLARWSLEVDLARGRRPKTQSSFDTRSAWMKAEEASGGMVTLRSNGPEFEADGSALNYNCDDGDETAEEGSCGAPRAILTCRKNSHPFQVQFIFFLTRKRRQFKFKVRNQSAYDWST